MALLHTPVKKTSDIPSVREVQKSPLHTDQAGPSRHVDERTQTSNVRRSVGEWELVKKRRSTSQQPKTPSPPRRTAPEAPAKPKNTTFSLGSKPTARKLQSEVPAIGSPPTQERFPTRQAEAKACLLKAKTNLDLSRNLKTDLKTNITQAINRLYELVKEAESAKHQGQNLPSKEKEGVKEAESKESCRKGDEELKRQIEEHSKLLRENSEKMETLKEAMERQKELLEGTTYANVAAGQPRRQPHERAALLSVLVSSKDDQETGEEVLNRIREAVNAKEGGIKVDRVRKAKDGKVIVGCRTEAERQKVKDRLKKAESHLNVEEIKNKDPLLILRDVLQCHSDDDIVNALRNQNGNLFKNLDKQDDRMEIRYRRKTRNPHMCHIVIRASPGIWNKMTEAGEVHIDLQRVRVADQSPLVQCSLCLGYGHGRRQCKDTKEKCSHCGGPHMRTECADWLGGGTPSCCNCKQAKLESVEHNAFSSECSIRKKWDAIARASVAYC